MFHSFFSSSFIFLSTFNLYLFDLSNINSNEIKGVLGLCEYMNLVERDETKYSEKNGMI